MTATPRPILRWPTARSRRWVDAFLDRTAGDPNLLAVVAIGSATRPGVESEDLDLLAIGRDRSDIAERPRSRWTSARSRSTGWNRPSAPETTS